jgi:ABC-2 type transport system permease protein
MSAGTVSTPGRVEVPASSGRAVWAVAGLAARLVRRGGLIVVAVGAGMSAVVVATYDDLMAGSAAAAGSLGALAANPAVRTLFGEPFALHTAGGFTVWRTGTVVGVLVGVWSILATTRITRGEEDAGRWNLLLAGRVPLRVAVATHLTVVGVVPVVLAVALGAVLAGSGASGAAVHAAGLGLIGLLFAGVGAFAAQVFPSRSAASGAAVAVLGVGLLARMVGDGVSALAWLGWLSPFGLLELSRPYAGNRWGPLVLLAAAAAVIMGVALVIAGRRDVGGGLVAPAPGRDAQLRLLGSVEGFAVRRVLRPLLGWSVGVGAYFLLIGLIATTMIGFLADNPVFAQAAGQAGFVDLRSVRGYAATLFALLAVPVGGFAAVRIGAFAAAEADRRLTLLAALPVSRTRLLGAELAVVTGAAVLLTAAAGVAAWLGVAVTGGDLALPQALAGVWNTVPVTLLCLGAAAIGVGWLPRLAAAIGALPAVGGFLLLVIAQSAGAPGWVVGLSPFAHLALVPVAAPNWPATLVMVGIALLMTALGSVGFHRRDLRV